MISFDYDKLLNAVIYFRRFPFSAVDSCVYTSDKHFVRSLIHINCTTLSAPVDDLLPELHSDERHRSLYCFRRHISQSDLDTDQNCFLSPREPVITQSVLKLRQFLESKSGFEGCFAYPINVFIVYLKRRSTL